MRGRKPFKRVNEDYWVAGVCGGIAYAFGIPTLWVRIIVIITLFCFTNSFFHYFGQFVFWFYLLAWFLAPVWGKDPDDYEERTA